jgi:hypothetical protein
VCPQIGLVNSILQIGPPTYAGPSDLTNAGTAPTLIQTVVSAGCLPTKGGHHPCYATKLHLHPKATALRGSQQSKMALRLAM